MGRARKFIKLDIGYYKVMQEIVNTAVLVTQSDFKEKKEMVASLKTLKDATTKLGETAIDAIRTVANTQLLSSAPAPEQPSGSPQTN